MSNETNFGKNFDVDKNNEILQDTLKNDTFNPGKETESGLDESAITNYDDQSDFDLRTPTKTMYHTENVYVFPLESLEEKEILSVIYNSLPRTDTVIIVAFFSIIFFLFLDNSLTKYINPNNPL
jgi:hypothetical protein